MKYTILPPSPSSPPNSWYSKGEKGRSDGQVHRGGTVPARSDRRVRVSKVPGGVPVGLRDPDIDRVANLCRGGRLYCNGV